jgi:hypothetical protein
VKQENKEATVSKQTSEAVEQQLELITVRRDGESDLRFRGKLIAEVNSCHEKAKRWWVLSMYMAEGGQEVLQRARKSRIDGEVPRHTVLIVDAGTAPQTRTEWIVGFFGRNSLAKELYAEVNIEDFEMLAQQ